MTVVVQQSSTIVDITEQSTSTIVINEESNGVSVSASSVPSVVVEQTAGITLEFFGNGPQGAIGPSGISGTGVVQGGTTGQVLAKNSNADYDVEWKTVNLSDLGDVNISGVTDGSVLVYDGASQVFKANSSLTSTSLTDGGNF
jgi:hypothetical protein